MRVANFDEDWLRTIGKGDKERIVPLGKSVHLLEDGCDIRTVQELLGHQDVRTTMVYTHVLNREPGGVRSPMDKMPDR